MSKGAATTIVLAMWGVLSVMALVGSKGTTDGSTYKRLWGAAVAATGLSVAADLVPEIVGPFALLIIIAAAVKNPGWFGNALSTPAAVAANGVAAGADVNPRTNPNAAGPPAPRTAPTTVTNPNSPTHRP